MTPEQVALVVGTPLVDVDALVDDVLARLRTVDPGLAELVGSPGLLARLLGVVPAIGDQQAFVAAAVGLGASTGMTGRWLVDVLAARPSVLASLASRLGDGWTPEVEEAWGRAYKLTVEAARSSATPG